MVTLKLNKAGDNVTNLWTENVISFASVYN